MGRSVSVPRNALWVVYEDTTDVNTHHQWEYYQDCTVEKLMELFPSVKPAKGYLGNEDVIIAQNGLVQFGLSEYCGCTSIWAVPRVESKLPEIFINRISIKLEENFGTLKRVAGFSDGTSVYERKPCKHRVLSL